MAAPLALTGVVGTAEVAAAVPFDAPVQEGQTEVVKVNEVVALAVVLLATTTGTAEEETAAEEWEWCLEEVATLTTEVAGGRVEVTATAEVDVTTDDDVVAATDEEEEGAEEEEEEEEVVERASVVSATVETAVVSTWVSEPSSTVRVW